MKDQQVKDPAQNAIKKSVKKAQQIRSGFGRRAEDLRPNHSRIPELDTSDLPGSNEDIGVTAYGVVDQARRADGHRVGGGLSYNGANLTIQ